MAQNPTPPPPSPEFLERLVNDARDTYARLFALMEHGIQLDAENPEEVRYNAFEKQMHQLMEEADIRLGALQEATTPWGERRRLYAPELTEQVDKFFSLLAVGLQGIKVQIDNMIAIYGAQKAELQAALEQLSRQRAAMKGYQGASGSPSRILEDKV